MANYWDSRVCNFEEATLLFRKCLLRAAQRRGMDVRKSYPRKLRDLFSPEIEREAWPIFVKRLRDNPAYWRKVFYSIRDWKEIRCSMVDSREVPYSLQAEIENVTLVFCWPRIVWSSRHIIFDLKNLDVKNLEGENVWPDGTDAKEKQQADFNQEEWE